MPGAELEAAQAQRRLSRQRQTHTVPPLCPTSQPHCLTLTPYPPPAQVPERKTDAALRLPISGIYKIKGVGDVLAGRVEQGIVKPGDEVIFMPTHTAANKCEGKVS